MTILLTGKDGQVGWELKSLLPFGAPLVALSRSELNLEDTDGLRGIVRRLAPSIIINAAAYTAVDHAESQEHLAMRINGIAPGVLAEEARRSDALLVHYSTDYVFDGEKQEPYIEDDVPNPLNVYGRTKLEGERAIAASGCRHLILRTSWVYAARGRNFLTTMVRLARERSALRIVDDQVGCPTWARDIAHATVNLLGASLERGTYHVCAQGVSSWYGFASAIFGSGAFERLGIPPPELEAVSSKDYPTLALRPRNSRLNCDRLSRIGIRLPEWQTSVEKCMSDLLPLIGAGNGKST